MERLRGAAAAATSIMIEASSRGRSVRRRCATCREHLQAQRHVGRSQTSLAHSAAAVEPWLQPQPWPPSWVSPLCSPAASPPSNARTLADRMRRRMDGLRLWRGSGAEHRHGPLLREPRQIGAQCADRFVGEANARCQRRAELQPQLADELVVGLRLRRSECSVQRGDRLHN